MKIHILTLFPEIFPGSLNISIIAKALARKAAIIHVYDLKAHQEVIDGTPYGGGSGMLIRPEVIHNSIMTNNLVHTFKIYMSPRGPRFNQATASALSKMPQEILILCGRYEGIDQRVIDYWDFHELSLGDFVLCGGEVAALTIIEACIRLVPGVMGNDSSYHEESFENGLLEYNQYTKPAIWRVNENTELAVPSILTTGNHQEIQAYRLAQSLMLTDDLNQQK